MCMQQQHPSLRSHTFLLCRLFTYLTLHILILRASGPTCFSRSRSHTYMATPPDSPVALMATPPGSPVPLLRGGHPDDDNKESRIPAKSSKTKNHKIFTSRYSKIMSLNKVSPHLDDEDEDEDKDGYETCLVLPPVGACFGISSLCH